MSSLVLAADIEARQPSSKNLEKKKNIILLSTKMKKTTQNFSKETTLAGIIDMLLTSREKSTQEKSIMSDP